MCFIHYKTAMPCVMHARHLLRSWTVCIKCSRTDAWNRYLFVKTWLERTIRTEHFSGRSAPALPMNTPLEVLAVGSTEMLCRPCVDCGLYTGRFCDYCYAEDRIPHEKWARGQLTPLCSHCDNRYDACHYCRGVHMARPFAWHRKP